MRTKIYETLENIRRSAETQGITLRDFSGVDLSAKLNEWIEFFNSINPLNISDKAVHKKLEEVLAVFFTAKPENFMDNPLIKQLRRDLEKAELELSSAIKKSPTSTSPHSAMFGNAPLPQLKGTQSEQLVQILKAIMSDFGDREVKNIHGHDKKKELEDWIKNLESQPNNDSKILHEVTKRMIISLMIIPGVNQRKINAITAIEMDLDKELSSTNKASPKQQP